MHRSEQRHWLGVGWAARMRIPAALSSPRGMSATRKASPGAQAGAKSHMASPTLDAHLPQRKLPAKPSAALGLGGAGSLTGSWFL